MSTESLVRFDDSGKTIYFCVFNNVGEVFDFDSGVLDFVSLASVVEPELAATEYADAGGAGKSQYVASLDLSTINNTAAIVPCTVVAFEQAGGSAAPDTDEAVSQPSGLSIQFGIDGVNRFTIHCGISTDTSDGVVLEIQAWLESDSGDVVPLTSSATCECQLRQIDAEADALDIETTDFGSVNAQYIFVESVSDPSFETDRQYRAKFTIAQDGVSWTITKTIYIVP